MDLCPPPREPIWSDGDWARAEAHLGEPFPESYKRLVAHYGAGTFGGEIRVLTPFAPIFWNSLFKRMHQPTSWLWAETDLWDLIRQNNRLVAFSNRETPVDLGTADEMAAIARWIDGEVVLERCKFNGNGFVPVAPLARPWADMKIVLAWFPDEGLLLASVDGGLTYRGSGGLEQCAAAIEASRGIRLPWEPRVDAWDVLRAPVNAWVEFKAGSKTCQLQARLKAFGAGMYQAAFPPEEATFSETPAEFAPRLIQLITAALALRDDRRMQEYDIERLVAGDGAVIFTYTDGRRVVEPASVLATGIFREPDGTPVLKMKGQQPKAGKAPRTSSKPAPRPKAKPSRPKKKTAKARKPPRPASKASPQTPPPPKRRK